MILDSRRLYFSRCDNNADNDYMPPEPLPKGNFTRLFGLLLLAACLSGVSQAQPAEGKPLKVSINGLEGRSLDNVRLYLGIWKMNDAPVANPVRLRFFHNRAEEEIRRALQPFGLYRPVIESDLKETPTVWEAHYTVSPGDPVRITELEVQIEGDGRDDPVYQRLLDSLPLAQGQVLEHPRYQDIKAALQNIAAERGYFDARLKVSRAVVNMQSYQAMITIHFDTGPRYSLGQVSFQQDALDPKFLDRYRDFQPGDPYEVDKLLSLQSDLINSEYFDQVEVQASPDRAEDLTLPVEVLLEPRKPRKYIAGIGYGTDTGVRGRLGVEGRYVNRQGHRYRIDLLASQIKYGLAGEYTIPGADPRTDRFGIRLSHTEEDSDTKTAATTILGFTKQSQLGPWLQVLSLDYLYETFEFSGEEQTTTLLIPGAEWSRVDAKDRLYARDGSRLSLGIKGAYEGLLSDVTFTQGTVNGKWIKSIGADGRFIARGQFGATLISGGFDKLPASLRFFAGGDRSVRGYSLDSIGPRDADDEVVGAKYLTVGSVEYDHSVRENWSVAAFVDAGDAFDDEAPDLKFGAGLGVRWLSPVGPVRVDLAHGFNEPGDAIRLHLTIGPDL